MLNKYIWQQITGEKIQPLIDEVNSIEGPYPTSPETAEARFTALPFYKDIILVEIDDSAWPEKSGPLWFLEKNGKFYILDGSSTPIHDANEAGPVQINEKNVLAYLDFFCFFIHGEEGPFFIVEDINHPAIDTLEMDSERKEMLEKAIFPARIEGKTDATTFEASAVVLYGNALFEVCFAITKSGLIEMIDDDCIAADLPARKIKPNY